MSYEVAGARLLRETALVVTVVVVPVPRENPVTPYSTIHELAAPADQLTSME